MYFSFGQCLLAQGFWTKSSWGFPKGKVDEGEQPVECAIREVNCNSLFFFLSHLDYFTTTREVC